MHDIVIHVVASSAYAGLAWHFWNTRWRPAPHAAPTAGLSPWERAALLVPLALQGWLLAAELFIAPQLRFGFAQALSVMLWLGVAIYWVESLFLRLEAGEGGKQCWMNVHYAIMILVDELVADYSHVAC